MKNFVVIGLGNFGLNISKTLQENNCEVLGIDADKETAQKAKDFVTHAVICDATNRAALESLGLKDFDGAIVSIGQSMAASILISMYLKEIGLQKIIVRAISEDHEKILSMLQVTEVVFPERDMARRMGKLLSMNNAFDYLPLDNDYAILEVTPPLSFVNKSLKDLGVGAKYRCQILGIRYGSGSPGTKEITIMAPSANEIIPEDSILIVLGKLADIRKLQES